ncbi:unnamed protein product [Tenebrio molitor]|jgi:hypothetical protein|nr:unnamed protein product [Tenebrio molitor]
MTPGITFLQNRIYYLFILNNNAIFISVLYVLFIYFCPTLLFFLFSQKLLFYYFLCLFNILFPLVNVSFFLQFKKKSFLDFRLSLFVNLSVAVALYLTLCCM